MSRIEKKCFWGNVLAFLAMAAAVFAIIVMFQYATFHFMLWDADEAETANWYAFWLPKVAAALIAASPLLLTRRRWWSVLVLAIAALWAVANKIYFHENNILISLDAIRMVGNLKGFESSATALLSKYFWVNVGLVVVYALFLVCLPKYKRKKNSQKGGRGHEKATYSYGWSVGCFVCVFLTGVGCSFGGGYNLYKTYQNSSAPGLPEIVWSGEWLNPFDTPEQIAVEAFQMERRDVNYTMNHSVVAYAVEMLYKGIALDIERRGSVKYTPREEEILKTIYHPERKGADCITDQNLIVILVESLESWTIDLRGTNGKEVAPNLNKLVHSDNVLYADKIVSQARAGRSGDGQMTVNSGMLPLLSGAACMLYSYNDYPSYATMFPRSVLITPTKNTWNKSSMFVQYGYTAISQPEDSVCELGHNKPEENWWDEQIIPVAIDSCRGSQPYNMMVLTLSMHSPFCWCNYEMYKLPFAEGIPDALSRYLAATRYADVCLGWLLDELDRTNAWENTTLVVTGDHTAFYDLNEFAPYAQTHFGFGEENYCPLIVKSSKIASRKEYKDVAYQMDIYPTILAALGCEDYYWKGFGINLMDESLVRPCDVGEAWNLSDKLIRDNYFSKH